MKALQNGEKLWADAIDNLLVQKLKYDREVQKNRQAGETAWSEAYSKLMKEREVWRDKINKDIQEGLKAWDTSEIALKENKQKAMEQLNQYMASTQDQWKSHVSGMQNVLVTSADTIETIAKNKKWFEEKIAWFNGKLSDARETTASKDSYRNQLAIYNQEYNYWINMESKFRTIIANSQDSIHNNDIRGTSGPGLLQNKGTDADPYVYTVEEFNLKMAQKELLALEEKKKEATPAKVAKALCVPRSICW